MIQRNLLILWHLALSRSISKCSTILWLEIALDRQVRKYNPKGQLSQKSQLSLSAKSTLWKLNLIQISLNNILEWSASKFSNKPGKMQLWMIPEIKSQVSSHLMWPIWMERKTSLSTRKHSLSRRSIRNSKVNLEAKRMVKDLPWTFWKMKIMERTRSSTVFKASAAVVSYTRLPKDRHRKLCPSTLFVIEALITKVSKLQPQATIPNRKHR